MTLNTSRQCTNFINVNSVFYCHNESLKNVDILPGPHNFEEPFQSFQG